MPQTDSQATAQCKTFNKGLVSYETPTEMQEVTNYAEPLFDKWWLGLSSLSTAKTGGTDVTEFLWEQTGKPSTVNAWEDGEPNNWHGIEHCGARVSGDGKALWNDVSCDSTWSFVCKTK